METLPPNPNPNRTQDAPIILPPQPVNRKISASSRRTSWRRGRIMEKLNLHSTSELVRFAMRHGLTD